MVEDVKAPNSISLLYEYADAGPLMNVTLGENETDQYYALVSPCFTVGVTGAHFVEKEAVYVFR